ncbi:DUF2971 domain-containing protein [Aeromonas caviae]|uniref:DUF2971 domain-containing protein n=1 Tax=Aeromonas caviae TaxID=648 RepID=UPI0029D8AEBA|nr:DUF2971 domain-containing protein [Aeromonas caviae]MDX7799013.1 DUF2971 domain-containing protein [Aeromonas caviae]
MKREKVYMGYVYKLRNTRSLLSDFHELENQEIFFASPEELNDPHEGFINLYWQGDSVVWKNLLRYYIFNLTVLLQTAHSNNEIELSDKAIHLNLHINNSIDTNVRESAYNVLESDFLGTTPVNEIIKYLSDNNVKLFSDELFYLLGCLHLLVLKNICNAIKGTSDYVFFRIIENANFDFNASDFINIYESGKLSEAAASNKNSQLVTHFKPLDENENITLRKNYHYILKEYSLGFINRLRELTYNDVYISCFMREFPNTDMWSYYGDSHKGCCLIFRTTKPEYLDEYTRNPDDDVLKITRFGGAKEIDMKIEPVIYNNEYPEVNFFDSVGEIRRDIYQECWLSDGNLQSYYFSNRYKNIDEWRRTYYSNMHSLFFRKTCHWSKENELRSIITTFSDETAVEYRKVTYRFDSLSGIVFGMKTSHADKCNIVRVIRDKCKENNVDDFKIYQAFYNHHENKMDKVELENIPYK